MRDLLKPNLYKKAIATLGIFGSLLAVQAQSNTIQLPLTNAESSEDVILKSLNSNGSLELLYQRESINSTVYTYQYYYNNVAVRDALVKKVVYHNTPQAVKLIFNTKIEEIQTQVPYNAKAPELEDGAWEKVNNQWELVLVEDTKNHHGVHVQVLRDIDGQLIQEEIKSVFNDTTGIGSVFVQNPITTNDTVYGGVFSDANDNTNIYFDASMDTVNTLMTYEGGKFKLKNQYIKLEDHSFPTVPIAESSTGHFYFDRSQDGFEDYNTLYHLNEISLYLKDLGYEDLLYDSLSIDPHGTTQDQSFFSTWPAPSLTFGIGGVDDAEDADVIAHEYGHAISYQTSPGSNSGSERQAIDEGYGDYLASAYSYQYSTTQWFKVMNWDGHNEFWAGRISNSSKIYPDDLVGYLYTDAPIWSSNLMLLSFNIGRETLDTLLLESMHQYSTGMTMAQAAELLIEIDSNMNNGANYDYLCYIQQDRGLVSGCIGDRPDTIYTTTEEILADAHPVVLNSEQFYSRMGTAEVLVPAENFKIKVHALDGQLIEEKQIYNHRYLLRPEQFESGAYLMTIYWNNKTETFKLIIQ